MTRVRLGAVGYLNARPLVYGLERSTSFSLRFDVPSVCAALLHEGAVDLGLIPSIEYLRGDPYAIVPGLAIASRGPVASVALYATRPMSEVASIALDTSSRTSVALTRVLCARVFRISPRFEPHGPDLSGMLARCDAALIIGDNALVQEGDACATPAIEKIDLGEAWTAATGLPFVYAFWAGRLGALGPHHVRELTRARDAGVAHAEEIGRDYYRETPRWQTLGARYLRDNIKYQLGDEERTGLELFFRYAVEIGLAPASGRLAFYPAE